MAEVARRLRKEGIEAFRAYLEELRNGSRAEPPRHLLTDPATSERFVPERQLEARTFETRLEAARLLSEAFDGIAGLEEDVGLWSWLSLFYFDAVCPAGEDGLRKPGRDYRHILEPGYPYGHRHLLGGAFLVYRLHGEDARLLLASSVSVENHFHHQLASRQAFLSNREIIRAANLLYLDPKTGRPKRGAQAVGSPGSLYRFIDLLQQLDVNYDLYSMRAEAIVDLLPSEFEKWRKRRWFRWGGRKGRA
ncbi:MAG: hypothetical protein D6795_07065 [Deltaproteobacteria bacterium]|nr:MAG: hypothetical protein D6795_07065 [Deltaproteobacteria bacterium]